MKTVLITIPWFSPAYKAGGPVQSVLNLVNQPVEGLQYRIFCGTSDLDGRPLAGIQSGRWVDYNAQTKVWYAKRGRRLTALRQVLRSADPDVVFVIGVYDPWFNLLPLLLARGRRRILSARGMLQPGALAQKAAKKRLYLGLWKALGVFRGSPFHASSAEEKACIRQVFGRSATVYVASNYPRQISYQAVGEKEAGALDLVSVALISPMKNILPVLQALQRSEAAIRYQIYGPVKDPGYWQQCEALIRTMPPHVTVCFHGDIRPEKVEAALATGHVFILPSESENFCHAIYEALSAGKPVITSCNTPWNGLAAAKAGVNVSTPEGGALDDAIRGFATMEQAELEAWSRGARAYAEAAVQTEAIREQYRRLFGLDEHQPEPETNSSPSKRTVYDR